MRPWHHTYGVLTPITNCSNNYGPYPYLEKLMPVVILKALQQEPIPVYGTGENVRDWLFVEDHVRALLRVLADGTVGETYTNGGHNEKQNIDVVHAICDILDDIQPAADLSSYRDLITFVTDRPGHDHRYTIDASKIEHDLGWTPDEDFASGLQKTVRWYLDHIDWCGLVTSDTYDLGRLGTEARHTVA